MDMTALRHVAKDLLLPFHADLLAFFEDVREKADEYDCVAFLTPRTAGLALPFLEFIADSTGRPMPRNLAMAGTLPSFVPAMAKARPLRWSPGVPRVLIVADIAAYGTEFNRVLDELASGLMAELDMDKDEAHRTLNRCVHLHVFMRNDKPLLIESYMQSSLTCAQIQPPEKWRDLCNRATRLCLTAGLSGQAMSVAVAADGVQLDGPPPPGFSAARINYDAFPEALFHACMDVPGVGALPCSLRVRRTVHDGKSIVVPFVRLPAMTEQELDAAIRAALAGSGIRHDAPFSSAPGWSPTPSMRMRLLTMLLSSRLALRLPGRPEASDLCRAMAGLWLAEDIIPANAPFADLLARPAGRLPEVRPASVRYEDCQALVEDVEDFVYRISLEDLANDYWRTQMYQEKQRPLDRTVDHFALLPQFAGRLSHAAGPAADAWIEPLADAGILDLDACVFQIDGKAIITQSVRPD